MAQLLTLEEKIERLTSLLTINKVYRVSFGKHSAEATLLESRKAKGKDQDKAVKKVNGKLVPCWLYQFDYFKALIDIESIRDIQITKKGAKIVFQTYEVTFENH